MCVWLLAGGQSGGASGTCAESGDRPFADLLPPLHAFAAHFRAPVLEVLHCAHKGARGRWGGMAQLGPSSVLCVGMVIRS